MRYLGLTTLLFLTLSSCLPSFNKSRLNFSSATPKLSPVETTPDKPEPPVPAKTFDEIMTTQCIKCHSKTLADPERLDRWMNAPTPEESKIFRSVESGKMPKNSPPLPTADLDVIRERVSNYQVKEKILIPKCLQCHEKTMNDPERYSRWIVPGKPEESRLYLAVESGRMPKKAPRLTDEELLVLKNYILNLR